MTDLLAADSWLVDDGRVRAVERHWARFEATCREHGVEPGALAELRAEVARAVPPRGRWFPRVELRADGELAVHVRPAPAREPTVVAWVADVADPRSEPRRKGPDLERLAALRERAAAHGAGEALLSDADGRLIEGAFTSLLWWEGETLVRRPRRRADPPRHHAGAAPRARARPRDAGGTAPARCRRSWQTARRGWSAHCTGSGS